MGLGGIINYAEGNLHLRVNIDGSLRDKIYIDDGTMLGKN